MITYVLPDREPELVDSRPPNVGDRVRVDGKLYRVDKVEDAGRQERELDGVTLSMLVATATCSLVEEA